MATSTPKYSGRIAVVGMAVQYAGSRNKDEFWETLTKNETKTQPMSEKRMGTKRKSLHLVDARPKYADTFNNDRYGTIDTDGSELEDLDNEHDLLLKLANDALGDMEARRKNSPADAANKDLRRFGIVSGCLSFPSDRLQGELLNLYQSHIERELPNLAGAPVLDENRSKWSRTPEWDVDPQDKRFYMDPATFVADELHLGGVRYSVDAACASALYVLKLASDHLLKENSDVDAMLCGGVCFPEPLFILTGFSCFHAMPLMGGLSMPLRKGTEGLTPGEGGSILVLKRYEDAVRDGDDIYGSLLGCRLNNSGQGQPLAPNKDSQTACLAECYKNIGVNPHMVQYVECHATGTPLGDVSECEAMYRVFEGRVPRFGSTKGNFGHTLVAAGFAGAAKVLLAMNKQLIPPTPGVDSETAVDARVVRLNPEPWPDLQDGRLKRAGLSAFGFGGTNAHAVFEEAKGGLNAPPLPIMNSNIKFSGKMSIIGLAAHFGAIKTVEELERCIYEGGDASCELPPKRWRFFSQDSRFAALVKHLNPDEAKGEVKPPRGCYVGDVDVDYKRIKTTLILEDQLLPQQLLALSTIEDALADSKMEKGGRVAVLVGLGTDLELYRHRSRVALRERLPGAVLDEKDVESKLMDYVHDKGTSTSYTSYIGNLIATRISSQWKFTGPSFTVTEGSNSVFRCLQIAEMMLATGDCEAVVVAGVELSAGAEAMYVRTRRSPLGENDRPTAAFENSSGGYYPGEGCGAFVLKRNEDINNNYRVYCSLDSLACSVDPKVAAEAALKSANVQSSQVDLIELSADTKQSSIEEVKRVGLAYSSTIDSSSTRRLQCVSTVKANVGHTGYASGAASIIKAALCLYNRYLPATPRWEEPAERPMWDNEARTFYVCPDSRAWVKNAKEKRYAGVSGVSESGSAFHLVLSEVDHQTENRACLAKEAPKLIVIQAQSGEAICQRIESELLPQLKQCKSDMEVEATYRKLLSDTVTEDSKAPFALALVCSQFKLISELEASLNGIRKSVISNQTWTSPAGSTFSPAPLRSSQIAFMYGDGAAPYGGLGRDIWRTFPTLHETCDELTNQMWQVPDDAWNPRVVSAKEHALLRKNFLFNQVEMFRSGVFFSTLFTWCCRDVLNIQPKAAFGLSLGEISMLFAFSKANSKKSDVLTERLTKSEVWTKQLSGKMEALRKAWGVSADAPMEHFWQGCILRGTRDQVISAINDAQVKHVRALIVNDDKTVLVCGFPGEIQQVAEKLGKGSLLVAGVPQGMVGHCPEVLECVPGIEYIHEHVRLPDLSSGIQLVSSYSKQPLQGKAGDDISGFVSTVYTSLADFPATVEAVYKNGAGCDVFVEVGPNSHRTAAVDSILSGRKHVAAAFDKQNKSSYEQVVRMMASLATQRVPGLCLSGLFPASVYAPLPPANPLLRNVIVNGRFTGILSSDISESLRKKLGSRQIAPSNFPLDRKPFKISRSSVSTSSTPRHSSPPLPSSIQGITLAPVPPPLSGMTLSAGALAPNQVTWHPLIQQAGPSGLSFSPTVFAPRNISFLPFDPSKDTNRVPGKMPLTWSHLCEFMCGKVSACLGPEFVRFDKSKTSRSPAFDLQVVTRVLSVDGIKPKQIYGVDVDPSVGSMVAEFDCPKDAWFFRGSSQDKQMPYSILMEIGLQTSGILTSVLKAPLTMNKDDILFRNLDASTELRYVPDLRNVTIVNKTHCTGYSMMNSMGIHKFHFELSEAGRDDPFYVGDTSFGWFTPEVFDNQAGLDAGEKTDCWHVSNVLGKTQIPVSTFDLKKDRSKLYGHLSPEDRLGRRSTQCEYLDVVDLISNSGKYGKGYAHGMKRVVKDDWFFSCHFWMDPVMPGSLGIESMLQALEMFCVHENIAARHGIRAAAFNSSAGKTSWKYRGQLTPKNLQMDCEVHVKSIEPDGKGGVVVTADGFLFVDRLRTYSATNLRLVIESTSRSNVGCGFSLSPVSTPSTFAFNTTAELKRKLLGALDQAVFIQGADSIVEVFPCTPQNLGDKSFLTTYGVDFPLYTGAMAKGIASADLVIASGKKKILASLGAGGLPLHLIVKALDKIQAELPNGPFMVNLIHSPFNENLEKGCVDLLLQRGVHFVEASAFMNVTIHVVRYRVKGLQRGGPNGVIATNKLIAKISRTELAEMFVRPAPAALIQRLLEQGDITPEQAELAKLIPLCDDIAVEADSGGHTDNRPLQVILPMIIAVRDRVHREMKYPRAFRVRVGAGGGIGCPQSVLAAFEMGAAFVVTGTINQMTRQSGSSDIVRQQLSKATYSDITMAPAADMFDQGVQLQVLKKGTMFAARAKKLYEYFVRYDSLDDIPAEERKKLEQQVFRKDIDTIWKETADYYINVLKDEAKILQAGKDSKLKMSLVFRWYLGLSSTWANTGVADRATDYQVWCGPAIGAFNDFIRGSYLDPIVAGKFPDVAQTNMQLFKGACYLRRARTIQAQSSQLPNVDVYDADFCSYSPDGEL